MPNLPKPEHLSIAACLLLAAPTVAQASISAALVHATVVAGSSVAAVPAPGSDVTSGLQGSTAAVGSGSSLAAQHGATATELTIGWQLGCGIGSLGAPGAAIAELEILYAIAAPVAMPAELRCDWLLAQTGTGTAQLRIDVGADGVVEATGNGTLPLQLGPTPIVIAVRASLSADAGVVHGPWGTSWTWSGNANATLTLRCVPMHAQVDVAAVATCPAAPTITALPDFAGGVDLAAVCPPGCEGALFVLGFAPLTPTVSLPLSQGCSLAVVPVATVWQWASPAQAAQFALSAPAAVRPNELRVQAVACDLDAPQLFAGDTLRLVLP